MSIRTYKQFTPKIGKGTYIDPHAIVIGNVTLGKDSSVWPMAVLRGDVHQIRIGDYTNIQDGSVCHVTEDDQFIPGGFSLTVGNHVTIGHNVILHGCDIGDYCLIGMGAIVLDGAKIAPNVMLAAGSLVPPGKVLESGFLWLGRPATKKRPLTKKERLFIQANAQSYIAVKNNFLEQNTL